jgi:hypothetical protein
VQGCGVLSFSKFSIGSQNPHQDVRYKKRRHQNEVYDGIVNRSFSDELRKAFLQQKDKKELFTNPGMFRRIEE